MVGAVANTNGRRKDLEAFMAATRDMTDAIKTHGRAPEAARDGRSKPTTVDLGEQALVRRR